MRRRVFFAVFCLPKPSDSCSLVRFSFHTTSQSGLRPPAPLVGEPLARRQSFAECQGLPSVGEVAMRSIDGEVFPAAAHGQAVLRTTSQALRASSPSRGASGETVHFAGTAKASPTRSNGDDRRQWRKQGVAVGAAASRMQATAQQTLGAATRAVASRQR